MISHYLEALKFQTNIGKAVAIFGGKTPHPQSIVVGGVTSVADMLNPQRLNDYIFIIKEAKDFIDRAYLPDAKLLARSYRDEIKAGIGRANGNFLSVGGYSFEGEQKLFCDGVIHNHDISFVIIVEEVFEHLVFNSPIFLMEDHKTGFIAVVYRISSNRLLRELVLELGEFHSNDKALTLGIKRARSYGFPMALSNINLRSKCIRKYFDIQGVLDPVITDGCAPQGR